MLQGRDDVLLLNACHLRDLTAVTIRNSYIFRQCGVNNVGGGLV